MQTEIISSLMGNYSASEEFGDELDRILNETSDDYPVEDEEFLLSAEEWNSAIEEFLDKSVKKVQINEGDPEFPIKVIGKIFASEGFR